MPMDEQWRDTEGKECIELLIEGNGVKVWMPASGTALRIINKNLDVVKVQAVRVRKLYEETRTT